MAFPEQMEEGESGDNEGENKNASNDDKKREKEDERGGLDGIDDSDRGTARAAGTARATQHAPKKDSAKASVVIFPM